MSKDHLPLKISQLKNGKKEKGGCQKQGYKNFGILCLKDTTFNKLMLTRTRIPHLNLCCSQANTGFIKNDLQYTSVDSVPYNETQDVDEYNLF